jgi:hypothetical protein
MLSYTAKIEVELNLVEQHACPDFVIFFLHLIGEK